MLMHAQHLGRAFSVKHSRKGICNILKILTHIWLNLKKMTVEKHSEFGIGVIPSSHPSLANQYNALGISIRFKKHFSIFQEAFLDDYNRVLY